MQRTKIVRKQLVSTCHPAWTVFSEHRSHAQNGCRTLSTSRQGAGWPGNLDVQLEYTVVRSCKVVQVVQERFAGRKGLNNKLVYLASLGVVAKRVSHPTSAQYSCLGFTNAVAFLRRTTPFTSSQRVRPIILAHREHSMTALPPLATFYSVRARQSNSINRPLVSVPGRVI